MELLERVRIELYELIEKYGTKDVKVVEKSQELDRLLNEYKYTM
jgi:hypothetical protein